jgi:hypothetical protein
MNNKFRSNFLYVAIIIIVIVGSVIMYNTLFSSRNSEKIIHNNNVVNVKDFGTIGDGETEDTIAFKKAITYAEKTKLPLFIPEGKYIITDTLKLKPISIYGSGEGRTILIFKNLNGKDGISFNVTKDVGVKGEVSDLTIIARGSNGGAAITTPKDGELYSKYQVRYSFHDLEFRGDKRQSTESGYVYDYGWKFYIDLGDSWGAYINSIDAIGTYKITDNPSLQEDQTFLRLSASRGILTARVNGITTHSIKRAVEIHDRAFFMIDQCDFAHSYEGIIDTGDDTYSEGRITNTLVNAQNIGIDLSNRSWIALDNVSIGRHKSGYDHGGTWYGIRLNDVNKSWVSNIRSQVDTSITKYKGTSYGFYFKDCDGITANGLIPGSGIDVSIMNDNTRGATFDGTNFQGDGGTAWRFINNSKNIVIGTFLVNSSVKTTYSSDDSINKDLIKVISTSNIP